jgi:hypothetical protein
MLSTHGNVPSLRQGGRVRGRASLHSPASPSVTLAHNEASRSCCRPPPSRIRIHEAQGGPREEEKKKGMLRDKPVPDQPVWMLLIKPLPREARAGKPRCTGSHGRPLTCTTVDESIQRAVHCVSEPCATGQQMSSMTCFRVASGFTGTPKQNGALIWFVNAQERGGTELRAMGQYPRQPPTPIGTCTGILYLIEDR